MPIGPAVHPQTDTDTDTDTDIDRDTDIDTDTDTDTHTHTQHYHSCFIRASTRALEEHLFLFYLEA